MSNTSRDAFDRLRRETTLADGARPARRPTVAVDGLGQVELDPPGIDLVRRTPETPSTPSI